MSNPQDEFKKLVEGLGGKVLTLPEKTRDAATKISFYSLTEMSMTEMIRALSALITTLGDAQSRCRDCTRDDSGKITEPCGSCDRLNDVVHRILNSSVKLAHITAIAMTPGSRAYDECNTLMAAEAATPCSNPECEFHHPKPQAASDDALPEGFKKL